MLQRLSDIANNQEVRIASISVSSLRVKLLEMGLIEGQSLRVLFRAPMGDPIAVDVNGYVLSLRIDEAALVQVENKSEFP